MSEHRKKRSSSLDMSPEAVARRREKYVITEDRVRFYTKDGQPMTEEHFEKRRKAREMMGLDKQ